MSLVPRAAVRAAMLALCILLIFPWTGHVRAETVDVTVPLMLDTAFLREAVVSQAYTDAGESARVWDDGSGCNHMVLSDPRVATAGGRLRLETRGEARVGTAFGSRCLLAVDWSGRLAVYQDVSVEPGGTAVRFEVVDSELPDGGVLGEAFWNLVKDHVHPRLDAVRIDLRPPLNELKAVLPLLMPGEPETVAAIIDSVGLGSVEVVDGGLRAVLRFRVEAADEAPVAAGSEAPLNADELARFQAATQSWDAFVTFIVKYLAATTAEVEVRRDLLFVLIEARYDILRILGGDTAGLGPSPVRTLFVRTWSRLAPILRRLSSTRPGQQGLNLLGFIAAADALEALDAIGPRINLELSADGLRRMARVLAPDSAADPLHYDEGVDSELRGLFDFDALPENVPVPEPQDGGDDDGASHGAGQSLWRLVPLSEALASTGHDKRVVARLNRWVPEKGEMPEYLPMVRDLLHHTALKVAGNSDLDGGLHDMFRDMVLATAWQETCWRQFVQTGDKLAPVTSPGGAVGIMQVIPAVWRGFYDGKGLARDIAYNAAAGSEILMHYLVDYAIARGEHEIDGGTNNLPRAAYAAYNGGPSHLRRYRTARVAESLQRIDQSFWDKYRTIAGGDELAVAGCFS